MSWRALINWALRPIFDFADDRWNACDGETRRSMQLGGCSLAEEYRRHTTGARPTDFETLFHAEPNTPGRAT